MELKKLFLKKVEESEMPLNREEVEKTLEGFGANGATSQRLAKKLTNGTAGAVVTDAEVAQFLHGAVNDDPRWVELVGGCWRLVKLQQLDQEIESGEIEVEGNALTSEPLPVLSEGVATLAPSETSLEADAAIAKKDKYSRWMEELVSVNADTAFPDQFRELEEELRIVPERDLFRKLQTAKGILLCAKSLGSRIRELETQAHILTQERDAKFSPEDMQLLTDQIVELQVQVNSKGDVPVSRSIGKTLWGVLWKLLQFIIVFGVGALIVWLILDRKAIQQRFWPTLKTVIESKSSNGERGPKKKNSLQRVLEEYEQETEKKDESE